MHKQTKIPTHGHTAYIVHSLNTYTLTKRQIHTHTLDKYIHVIM